jgi:hypothetical protein
MLPWRILVDPGQRAGHTYSQPDLTIAATALAGFPKRCRVEQPRHQSVTAGAGMG